MPSHTCVCAPAGFAQPPWPNPARNILRLGFRARDHFDIWAKSGPCPASYKAVHGWAELVADHATAGFGLPMAQTPLPVAGGMRCRCSIVSILGFPKLGSRSLLLGPAPGEKWSCARLLTKPRSGDAPPPRYQSPRGTPTLPAKVQGGVVGGDHLAGQRSKVGCGPGTLRSHLAGYHDKVPSGRPTFPVQGAFTTVTLPGPA